MASKIKIGKGVRLGVGRVGLNKAERTARAVKASTQAVEVRKVGTAKRKEQMLITLVKTLGVVTAAADIVGISANAHYLWLKSDMDYADAVEELKNRALDFAESSLFSQIQKKNTAATIFYLKTKGKHRGYVEAQFNFNTEVSKDDLKSKTEEELLEILHRKV